jgi:DNA-binding transcriptional LysR family regulator
MKLSQLRIFCAVIEQGTIAAAAEILYCVPSNITMRIHELEHQLGVALFSREKNRLMVTPEGRLLYRKAKNMLEMATETEQLFYNVSKTGLLNVGALDVALGAHLPQRIADYLLRVPGVELNLYCGQSFALERQLIEGELDLIISDGPVEHPLLTSTLAFRESLKLLTPMGVSYPSAVQLARYDLYVFGDKCYYRHQVNRWLELSGVSPRAVLEMESYPVMFACVTNGVGCACVPESLIADTPPFQVHSLNLIEPCDMYFVWHKHLKSPVVAEFIRILSEQE